MARSSPNDDRIVLAHTESERALIGALLLAPHLLSEVCGQIDPADFYTERHRNVYQAMLVLYQQGMLPDLGVLSAHLLRTGWSHDDTTRLIGYMNEVPSAYQAPAYARQVRQAALLRQMAAAARQATLAVYQHAHDPATALAQAMRAVDDVAVRVQAAQVYPEPRSVAILDVEPDAGIW